MPETERRTSPADHFDVSYRIVDSPIGELLLAATPAGLVRVGFGVEGFDAVLRALSHDLGERITEAPRALDPFARELDDYFAGRVPHSDLPFDFTLSHGFRRTVQRHLGTIGYGTTRTYAEVAAAVDHPGAARAVGSACATNPLAIFLPCHRVVRADGSLGGYRGGIDAKAVLLALEQSR